VVSPSQAVELTAEVEAAPSGPKVGAFFDFDGTLISGYSARAFVEDRLRRRQVPPLEVLRGVGAALDMALRGGDVTGLMRVTARSSRGQPEEELIALGQRLWRGRIAGMAYPEARALVQAHQRRGHTVVLASSATPYQVGPFAADLGIDHVLCTRFEVADGHMTGELDGPVLWGEGKAAAVRSFAAAHGVDLAESFGYANGDEDIAFLEAVGNPRPLNPAPRLAKAAEERGWPVRRFRRRDGVDLPALARTGAAVVGLTASAGAALAVGLLNRSRRDAANFAASAGTDLTLALAGVRLSVVGEEHLWSRRPAIFVFNHQSSLDVLIIGNLLRRDVTGVAKAEAAGDPRFAVFGALAGVAYVDRSDTAQAVSALDQVLQRLREGVSIAIAPEGTRSATATLGPFKKGAFHMAMQAGVPVVPIVIRNAGELMWRGSMLVRPGTIDVAVLPPVDTAGWRREDLDDHVEEVRRQFLAILDDWPAPAGS
jgi:putative phosphoserine phosphatase/1-acylglycerol-3-phosphate O-acyltransferase